MTRRILFVVLVMLASISASARETLRINAILSGNDKTSQISISELINAGPWAGRNVNMDKLILEGNGQVSMRDAETGKLLYVNSFSTLFQEWQNTEEATKVSKSFEAVLLLPMPEKPANVKIELFNSHRVSSCSLTFPVDPKDILIRPQSSVAAPHRYIHRSGSSEECIDLAFVAEGYTAEEMDTFYADAQMAAESIFSHEPFKSMKDRFNIVAVAAPSRDSGISVPHAHDWKDTAVGSRFDTFYSDRYLTTLNLFKMHDALQGIPYEHVVVLANTTTYGGAGIYNMYLTASSHNRWSIPVIVHEFGHSFAGLADEYFYDDQYEQYYFPDVEPWEPNITTLVDFESKWKGMLDKKHQKPVTKAEQHEHPERYSLKNKDNFELGVYEGAGYLSEGVYRALPQCRMKVNDYPSFCPVCENAIKAVIDYNTVQIKY